MGVSQWLIQNFRSGGGGGKGGWRLIHSDIREGAQNEKKIFATLQMVPLNLQRLLLTPPDSTESNQEE